MIRSIFSLSYAAIYSNISDYPTYHNIISIKKNYNKYNLMQSIGCFFDDAELTNIAGTAQGICNAKEQPED